MRQELNQPEWYSLTVKQRAKILNIIGREGDELPTLGELIEFLHSTGYDWEIDFRKVNYDPTGEVETDRDIFRVRILEDGWSVRDKELIVALFKAVKEVLGK